MKYFNKRNIVAAYSRWLYYTKAWKTNKKIVVIESDDWGSIRTSTKEAYDALMNLGYDMTKSPYTLDALETNEDLLALYKVLNSVKDSHNNSPCFTANMIMANPDFTAIANNNFTTYVYETVDKTLKKHQDRDRVRDLWKEGMEANIFFPQLHAREHVRYWDWMNDLRANHLEAKETFKYEMCGVPRVVSKKGRSYFHPPYIDDKILIHEKVDLDQLISEGAKLFKSEFGFESKTTIAPNCGWTKSTEKIWADNNIEYMQGGFLQEHYKLNGIKYIPHYLGEKSKIKGLTYLVRNCTFEPAYSKDSNYWKSTYKQIENAFNRKAPAIISTHRVNYVGSIDESNREKGLEQLSFLLNELINNHPDVVFMNTLDFANLLDGKIGV